MGWCGSAAGSCHTVCPCSDAGHAHSVRPRAASDKAWCIFMSADLSYVSPAVAGCSVKLRIILHMQGPLFPEKRRPAGASARCSRRVAGEGHFFLTARHFFPSECRLFPSGCRFFSPACRGRASGADAVMPASDFFQRVIHRVFHRFFHRIIHSV